MKRLRFEDRTLEVDEKALLGVGGEANVYRAGEMALKLFHPAGAQGGVSQAELRLKEQKVARFPHALPSSVVAPLGALRDADGLFVGYAMPLVENARPLGELFAARQRPRAALSRVLYGLAETLAALHAREVRVGDLNDNNVLVSLDSGRHYLIDVDSYQFAGLPCTVAHERYLDPRLYGIDLGRAPRFEPEHDWYAFAVMLFSSIYGIHPYGGVHPRLNTLLKRATARVSVLDPAVRVPRLVPRWEIIPDRPLAWLQRVFEEGGREQPPQGALRLEWSCCPRCGTEHARLRCPECLTGHSPSRGAALAAPASQGMSAATQSTRETLVGGPIVAVAVGATLRYQLYREGRLVDESGRVRLEGFDPATTQIGMAGDKLAVLRGEQLLVLDEGGLRLRQRVASFEGRALVETTRSAVYYVADDTLCCDEEPYRIAPVIGGQTWFAVGERLGIVHYRTATLSFFFTFVPGRVGLRPLSIPTRPGRQRLRACFDRSDGALLEIVREEAGREWLELSYIRGGVVRAHRREPLLGPHGLPALTSKILRADQVVCASDEGIVRLRVDVDRGTIDREAAIPDSERHVDAATSLFDAPGGALCAVHSTRIVRLDLA